MFKGIGILIFILCNLFTEEKQVKVTFPDSTAFLVINFNKYVSIPGYANICKGDIISFKCRGRGFNYVVKGKEKQIHIKETKYFFFVNGEKIVSKHGQKKAWGLDLDRSYDKNIKKDFEYLRIRPFTQHSFKFLKDFVSLKMIDCMGRYHPPDFLHYLNKKKVQYLRLEEQPIKESILIQSLLEMKNLEYLDLSCTGTFEEQYNFKYSLKKVEAISKLSKLKHLKLSFNQIADEGCIYLANLNNLRSLDFSENRVFTSDGIRNLTNNKLEYLDISKTRINNKALLYLKKFQNLKTLILYDVKVDGKGLIHLNNLPHLRDLQLSLNNTKKHDLQKISISTLKSLGVTGSDAHNFVYMNLPNLEKIYLLGEKITDNTIKLLMEKHLNLKYLSLINTNVTDLSIEYLSAQTNLKYLKIQNAKITSKGCKFLNQIPSLEYLNLKDCKNIKKINFLIELSNLKHINLKNTGVTNEIFKFLPLQIIDINLSKTKLKNLFGIEKFKHLKILDISYNKLKKDYIVYLRYLKSNGVEVYIQNSKVSENNF